MNTVNINGEEWVQNEKKESASKGSSKLFALMAMGGDMFGNMGIKDNTPKVNIVDEYALIMRKESTLTMNQRDWVKWQFESNFTKL